MAEFCLDCTHWEITVTRDSKEVLSDKAKHGFGSCGKAESLEDKCRWLSGREPCRNANEFEQAEESVIARRKSALETANKKLKGFGANHD